MNFYEKSRLILEMVKESPDEGLHATAALPPDIAAEIQANPRTRKTYAEWRGFLDEQFAVDSIERYEALRRGLD